MVAVEEEEEEPLEEEENWKSLSLSSDFACSKSTCAAQEEGLFLICVSLLQFIPPSLLTHESCLLFLGASPKCDARNTHESLGSRIKMGPSSSFLVGVSYVASSSSRMRKVASPSDGGRDLREKQKQ